MEVLEERLVKQLFVRLIFDIVEARRATFYPVVGELDLRNPLLHNFCFTFRDEHLPVRFSGTRRAGRSVTTTSSNIAGHQHITINTNERDREDTT